jgi:DNA modification methylase
MKSDTVEPPETDQNPTDARGVVGCSDLLSPYLDSVICGDNCEVMRGMPSESIDLVVTSPPYDDLRTYGGHEWDFYGVAWNLARLLKLGGVIVWVVDDRTKDGSESGTSMEQALHFRRIGLNLHDTMIYQKANPMPYQHNRYQPCWEYAFVISKGKPNAWNPIMEDTVKPGGKLTTTQRESDNTKRDGSGYGKSRNERRYRHNVWKYNVGLNQSTSDKSAFDHPAIFPESLAKDHIQSWSNPGAIVLDPFAGSGTTLKAAKELNRKFIGIEINQEYVDICEKRTAQEVLQF